MSNMADSRNTTARLQNKIDGERPTSNFVSVISKFADDHLTIVRNLSVGVAVTGILICARSIKLITKFSTASEIPARFIEKNVSLRGKVHGVTEKVLEVEHIPISIPLLSRFLRKCQSDARLDVHLAGVELTEGGREWLRQHLIPKETVWFRLIRREESTLDCFVSVSRGFLFTTCVNEEVLRLGLGKTVPILGLHHQSHLYWKLHKRLLKAEIQAERKGRGQWKQKSLLVRALEAFGNYAIVRWLKTLFKQT